MEKTLPRLVLIGLVTPAAYLALAVIGWGGLAAYFSHLPLTILAVVLFALSAAAVFTDGNLSAGEREDRGNRWVLAVLGLVGLLAGILPAWADRKGVWIIDGDIARWLGVALFAGGGTLRIWPVFVLGRRFSGLVAIQAGHALVTSGPYGDIRHPSYLGLLISSLGWGLAFRSWVGVLLAFLMIPPLLARISAEERMLQAHFGADYEIYRARTSRLIPGIW